MYWVPNFHFALGYTRELVSDIFDMQRTLHKQGNELRRMNIRIPNAKTLLSVVTYLDGVLRTAPYNNSFLHHSPDKLQ